MEAFGILHSGIKEKSEGIKVIGGIMSTQGTLMSTQEKKGIAK